MLVGTTVFLYTWTLTTHGKYSVSGDEPHYLIIAESLRSDGDLDLANNYAEDDGRLFGHTGLKNDAHAVPSRRGDLRSIHPLGLPVLVLPVYVAAQILADVPSAATLRRFRMDRGLFAYSIVSLSLAAMTAFAVALLAGGLATVTKSRYAAAIAVTAGISPPVVSHAFLVFPEIVAFTVTCLVVWFSLKRPGVRDGHILAGLMLIVGMLPWFHVKYFVYAPALLAFLFVGRWSDIRVMARRRRGTMALLFVAPQLILVAWAWYEWGTLGGALTTEGVPLSWAAVVDGAGGLLFDRQSGLLVYAPIYWIVPACWWLTRRHTWAFAVPVATLYLPAAAFVMWWAGFAPAARYLVPAVPFLAVSVARAFEARAVRVAAAVVAALQIPVNAMTWQRPRTLWPANESNPALEALGVPGRAYAEFLPAMRLDGMDASVAPALFAAAGVTILLIVGATWRHRERSQTP